MDYLGYYGDLPVSLERMDVGFRAIQGGLDYESTIKLMDLPLHTQLLDMVAEALTEDSYTPIDGRIPNSVDNCFSQLCLTYLIK